MGGGDPSAGKATRRGPTAPRWRKADDAPGPPLKRNVTGRSGPAPAARYDTENISAAGFSLRRSTVQ